MKRLQIVQIIMLFLFVTSFFVVFFTTDVYDQVQRKIVEELCLSCVKLKPNTIKEYRFETANRMPHPDFILENLSKGPVILDYRITFCPGCNELEKNILSKVFNYTFRDPLTYPDDPDLLNIEKEVEGTTVTFIHIHTGDKNSKDVLIGGIFDKSRDIYDVVGDQGNPMLVFITYGYNNGFVEPYYSTIYGVETEEEFLELVYESVNLYNEHKDAAH
jgi:hypothetical protein